MPYYPLFLDLTGADILVVGAGAVGRRKIASLLKALPRSITVLDPALDAISVEELGESGPVHAQARAFVPEDVTGKRLVFAATNRPEINDCIAELCAARGILCNSATAPLGSGFIVPAHFTRDGLTVAVSTEGQSPALSRLLREELEAWVGKRYSPLLVVMGRLRPLVLALGLPTSDNTALFRALVHSPLAGHLEKNEHANAAALLERLLPEPLRARVGELLDGL